MDWGSVLDGCASPPMGIPETFLLGADFMNFITKLPGTLDARRHVLYSFKTYPVGGQTKLSFFDQNIGAATNNEGDTNMQQASMLSGQELFVILNIRMKPQPAQADYDTAAPGTPVAFGQWNEVMERNCWLDFKIGRKKDIDTIGPLALFPPGFGPPRPVVAEPNAAR